MQRFRRQARESLQMGLGEVLGVTNIGSHPRQYPQEIQLLHFGFRYEEVGAVRPQLIEGRIVRLSPAGPEGQIRTDRQGRR